MKIYIPLIAVNSMTAVHCEQFSVKNSVKLSLYDAAAAGFGASIVFLVVGAVRELLGTGRLFDCVIYPEDYGMLLFVLAPGAFLALGYLIAIVNKLRNLK